MTHSHTTDNRPLVLLDVDGVINDLGSLRGMHRPFGIRRVRAGAYTVHIPDYMPRLIQRLCRAAEVVWCTTWRHNANTFIAPHLGIDELSVIDDGTNDRYVGWKAAAAASIVSEAVEEGRRVFWIEDFYGEIPKPQLPDAVVYVDTTTIGPPVLTPAMLPAELLSDDSSGSPLAQAS